MPAITPTQVRAQVLRLLRQLGEGGAQNGGIVVGIYAPGDWQGGGELVCGEKTFRVVQCRSELQTREAMLDHAGQPLVILSTLDETNLSGDVRIRFAKRTLIPLSGKAVLLELFQARILDPQLLSHKWLVGALLERMPEGGFAPVPDGILDVETVWGNFLRLYLGIDEARPGLESFLRWAIAPESIDALEAVRADCRADLESWLESCLGKTATFIFAAIRNGRGADLLQMGVVLGVVYSRDAKDSDLRDAAVRLEKVFDGRRIHRDAAESWSGAAASTVRKLLQSKGEPAVRALLNRVDTILDELQIAHASVLSDYSPSGLEGRLSKLAETFSSALDNRDALPSAADQLSTVARHFLSGLTPERMNRCTMALRILRWLHVGKNTDPADLLESSSDYVKEGSFVDWARHALFAGDGNPALAKAFSRIVEAAGVRREKQDRKFAGMLAESLKAGHHESGVLPIESVIKEVVTPLVSHVPILFVVMDGMSHAVFQELLPTLTKRGWRLIGLGGDARPRPVLAALPSITDVSRRALLAGMLEYDSTLNEVAGFEKLGEQMNLSKAALPQLFRKGELTEVGETGLPDKLVKVIGQTKNRLLGVVVNAIDDYLLKGDQLAVAWNLALLPALEQLLHAAHESGRVVVLASDHGHIIDRETELRKAEGGDRYRPDNGNPTADELVFRGPRIRAATGHESVILPITERLRYAGKKNGYHGGATPQEVLAPLAVLTNNSKLPPGWEELPPYEPEWWNATQVGPHVQLPAAVISKSLSANLPLFDFAKTTEAPAPAHWSDALLSSQLFAVQQKFAGRTPLDKPTVRAFLISLEERGFAMLRPALAQKLNLPIFRVGGLVSTMQRILNVDGYEVLAFEVEADTVRLNVDLLKTQFELDR